MEIRAARPGDLGAITDIYNHYVRSSHVTFDVSPLTVDDRRPWFERHAEGGPHRLLVACDDGTARRIVGYASTGPWRPKPAYDTTVELSVYCAPDATGRGHGRALCDRLIAELAGEDLKRMVGGIALPNPGSIALMARLGFRSVGTFTEVGRKFGRYWDVEWFERAL
jgi:phosphinothricin acetyltransferase